MSTISDVARRAGVSPVTVSRVINRVGNVNAGTQQRVEQAIEDLGYVPSGVAQSLRSKRTRSLALIVPDIQNAFWTTVARGVEDAAQSRGYSVFLCNTDENAAKQQRYLDVVISQRVDGVIIAPFASEAGDLARLRDRNTPTVVIDRHIEGWEVDSVNGDSLSGARALVSHLIALGHRRIAMLAGPATTATAADRVAGYRIALAEAGIAEDPRLIWYGEYKAISGERMMAEALDAGGAPTAVFAANNAIAMGVIDELEHRGLRIPHDIALVSFDDLPTTSRLFPFLTVAVQPAYEIGANAAQLLLSRLDAAVPLQPRHVVLPTRLIIRYSCGSKLTGGNGRTLSLPLLIEPEAPSVLVPKVNPHLIRLAITDPIRLQAPQDQRMLSMVEHERSDVNRLLRVLRHQEADRLPHLALGPAVAQSVIEYVLERKLDYNISYSHEGISTLAPEDHVEFAQRLAMDAVLCDFTWRPNNLFAAASNGREQYVGGAVKSWNDLETLEPPPSLAQQLNHLERYLRAAQGTGVGVIAGFSSFFDNALRAVGVAEAMYLFYDNRLLLERLMDMLADHQRVMGAVCDRFGDDLALVLVNDDIAHPTGLLIHPDMFLEIFPQRMERLLAPAKEHGKLAAFHSDGNVDKVVAALSDIGFDSLHLGAYEFSDIAALRQQWRGKMALIGALPPLLLTYGSQQEIENEVQRHCAELAPGGGYVLGSSASITEGIPPQNLVALVQAVHRHGRYGH